MIRAVAICLLLLPLAVQGVAQGMDWGQAQVSVADRSVEARNKALAEGLGQVLVRLTADPAVANLPEAEPLLSDAGRWARQFTYQESAAALSIQMSFDVQALSRAAQQAGLPVWSLSRPPVLVWLVTPGAGRGEIIGNHSSASYAAMMRDAAAERGFPLLLPEWDSEDQALLQPADVRGQFDPEIWRASARYRAPFVATAVYSGGQIRWRLLRQGQAEASGTVEGGSEQQQLRQLTDQLVAAVAPRYIVRPGNEQHYRVTVQNIQRLPDWRALERYLTGLSGVSSVRLDSLLQGQVVFELGFSGLPEQLHELLAMNPALVPCEAQESAFCWQGR